MRITNTALDSTLSADVEAGALDAFERGVSVFTLVNDVQVIKNDKLVLLLLVRYCMGQEDYQGKSDMYKRNYEELCNSMSQYKGYRADAR